MLHARTSRCFLLCNKANEMIRISKTFFVIFQSFYVTRNLRNSATLFLLENFLSSSINLKEKYCFKCLTIFKRNSKTDRYTYSDTHSCPHECVLICNRSWKPCPLHAKCCASCHDKTPNKNWTKSINSFLIDIGLKRSFYSVWRV